MALTIADLLRAVNPNIGLVVNPDGSFRVGVEDVNSDEIRTAVEALNTALQAGGVTQAQLAAILAAVGALETDIVLATGTNVIGSVLSRPERFDFILKPFGKGSLTTDGVQYSAEVSGITHAAYGAIETVTITQPTGYTLQEIELGLTMAIASSGATKHVKWKFQGSDNGAAWEDLIAAQTRVASAAAYLDVSALGRFAPTGNFLGTGATFQLRGVIQAEDADETASGKHKSSSYIICKYRRS